MMHQGLTARVRDVAISLYACREFHPKLGRVQLQKFLYLLDTLALCTTLLPTFDGHETFHHGPFDHKIQTSVDLLVFWGVVSASEIRSSADHTSCNYALSQGGLHWVEGLLSRNITFSKRTNLALILSECLSKRGKFATLKELVYLEPTFSYTRDQGMNIPLPLGTLDANLSAQVLALLERSFVADGISLTTRFIVDFFLEYLETRGSQLLGEVPN